MEAHLNKGFGQSNYVNPRPRFAIVGGLGAVAGADILHRVVKSTPIHSEKDHLDISFVQRPFREHLDAASPDYNPTRRKLYVYDMLKNMEADNRDIALVPCFISQTFLDEICPEIGIKVLGIADAIKAHLMTKGSYVRIGVLTSNYVRKTRYLETFFKSDFEVVYPSDQCQSDLMHAIYGPNGLKSGTPSTKTKQKFLTACAHLVDKGANLVLPGFTDIPALLGDIYEQSSVEILNCNQIYADYVVKAAVSPRQRRFKVGVVGGIGPAATVDFMDKIVLNTTASKDQEHIKVVVEQNPQIPDRTQYLVGNGSDPTIALYATCKKLEQAGANVIAIPCNTAHAFVDRIQPNISVSIINMLTETITEITSMYPDTRKVGLLATKGTIQSGLYHNAAVAAGLELIVPDESTQSIIMDAIYGTKGVKAGYTEGHCCEQVIKALKYLESRSATVAILGCTELPLVMPALKNPTRLTLLDPTNILARRCVALATS